MTRKYGGDDLARLLLYYGFVGDISSSDFNICCPFHDDPVPSMHVTLGNGIWHCFGCGLTGNAYDFVRAMHPEIDELQALVVLEKIVHSKKVGKLRLRYKKKNKKSNEMYLDQAKDYYYGLPITDWHNVKTKEESEALSYMEKRGYTKRHLIQCRCKANNYSWAYPILFPILDNDVFMGHVSRTTKQNVESGRKYLYNEGFKKRYTLCGVYRENSVPFICEGYMDYLSLRAKGKAKNVVALLGWHASDEQINKLKQKNITKVICALDNPEVDKAGEKGITLLRKHFQVISFSYPPGVKDPGDMSEKQLMEAVRVAEDSI